MKLSDTIQVEGTLAYRVRRRGRIVEDVVDANLVMDLPRNLLAQLVAGDIDGLSPINRIGFDTNATAAAGDDDELGVGSYLKAITGHTIPLTGKLVLAWSLDTDEGNGTSIAAFALVCADDTLFSRRARSGVIEKDEDVDLEGTWTVQF